MRPVRRYPVTYEDCSDIGLGIIPVIEEGEPPPEAEHYAEAARLEEARRRGLPIPSDRLH